MTTPVEHRQQVAYVTDALDLDEAAGRAALVRFLDVRPGMTVLDVGSGPGCSVPALEAAGARTICLDLEPAMLAQLRGPSRICAKAEEIPVRSQSVDRVLCVGVLHSLTGNVSMTLAELARVVKPGGNVVVGNKGIAPWLDGTDWYRRAVKVLGIDAREWPPLLLLPRNITDVTVRWDWLGPAFYALTFRVL